MIARAQTSKDDHLDRVFRALGDRTRRALLTRLTKGPAMVTELAKPFAMSLPAVSRHVKVLERAGLVSRTIDGRVHNCSLQPNTLANVQTWLDKTREHWEGALASLARFVEEEQEP